MLTPLDIETEVREIRRLRAVGSDLAALRAAKMEQDLFLAVLEEIARGSIDPRSLAMAVLEVKR